jgi:hypothetical protein
VIANPRESSCFDAHKRAANGSKLSTGYLRVDALNTFDYRIPFFASL